MSFRQPFVYCCICFIRPSSQRGSPAFWLTSCAHIFCPQHASGFNGHHETSAINVDSSSSSAGAGAAPISASSDGTLPNFQSCPFCNTPDISVACLDSSLPPDLAIYFRPADDLMTDVMSVVKFQTRNLLYLAKHYESQSKRTSDLQEKVQSQQDILENVRQELHAARKWKERLDEVTAENTRLRAKLGLSLSHQDDQDARVLLPSSSNGMPKIPPGQSQTTRISKNSSMPYPPPILASPALSVSSMYRNAPASHFRDVAGIRVGSAAGGPMRNGVAPTYQNQNPGRISSVASPFFHHSTPRRNMPHDIPHHGTNDYNNNKGDGTRHQLYSPYHQQGYSHPTNGTTTSMPRHLYPRQL